MKKEKLKTFSMRKLLLTILCTVIVSVFIGTTILFAFSIPTWIQAEVVMNLEKDSEVLIEIGKGYKESFQYVEEMIEEEKATFGEDYPSGAIFLSQLTNIFLTKRIMEAYTLSFLIGIALGIIIYIVVLQNIKWKQIIIELVVAFIIIFMLIKLINLGYESLINKLINDLEVTDVQYSAYIYDLESNNILIPYIIVAVLIYVINLARQKILTHKLNKELNNK